MRGPPIYCVAVDASHPPLALGMVLAASRAIEPDAYRHPSRFHRTWASLERDVRKQGPGIVLFSDYIWSTRENLAISERLKREQPECITVHGGPDIPKDAAASAAFMASHPHIDIAVNGEGERTMVDVLRARSDPSAAFRETLADIPGLTFASANRTVTTHGRERVMDLDTLPSPYLNGIFDDQRTSSWRAAILETNRGCPYGCTFCDWGSATLQKIRTFGLDRIEAEIEWIARRGISIVFVADANFGILPRDVTIAEQFARAKERFGYPRQIVVNYAKNATERVAEIVRIFVRAGLTAHGIVSLQTTDPTTLAAIDRTNIKTERYEDLVEIFRRERLPLSTDLMLGLPAQTMASIKRDLQFAFDWALTVQFSQTQMLVNSPMAKSEYVQLHRLRTDARGFVLSTSKMNEQEAERARRLCFAFQVFVETGMLRLLLYHLQEEHGLRAIDVIEALQAALTSPGLEHTRRMFESMFSVGPMGIGQLRFRSSTLRTRWSRVYGEIRGHLEARYGIRADSALDTILETQRALMPRFGAIHPRTLRLPHDVTAYFRDLGVGYRSYLDPRRPRLRLSAYPPGSLEISDPERNCWSIPEIRMTYDSHHVPFELHSSLRLDSVRTRFLRKRDVVVLRLQRSRIGHALSRLRA